MVQVWCLPRVADTARQSPAIGTGILVREAGREEADGGVNEDWFRSKY